MSAPDAPPIPLRAAPVLEWVRRTIPDAPEFSVGQRYPLSGGIASPLVERVEILTEGCCLNLVAKRSEPAEITAMRLAGQVPDCPAFPELIDSGSDEFGTWLVMPFYPGSMLGPAAVAPAAVYECLARMHAAFLDRVDDIPLHLPRLDARWCRDTIAEFAPAGIRRAQRCDPDPVHDRALDLLWKWATTPLLDRGLALLAPTLLHGDVYGLNVVADGDNAWLIDWNCARVGPAMFDVAMAVPPTSPCLRAYLDSWADATDTEPDPWQVDLGYTWARFVTGAVYVGAVAERFGADMAATMLDETVDAHQHLADLLA